MKCLYCQKPIKSQNFYGLHKSCYFQCFKLIDTLEFNNLDPKKQDSAPDTHIKKTKDSFYHGQYRKYSARLGSTTYILKVQEEKFSDLPAIEYVCNHIAFFLNLNVPEYYLIRYQDKTHLETLHNKNPDHKKTPQKRSPEQTEKVNQTGMTFVTRNFMQDYKGGTLHHIYKFLPEGKQHYNCKNIIDVLFQQTNPADVARFIEIVLFDSLIGNNDRHGRNLGIIESTRRKQLAPMYDNPSYFGTEINALIDFDFNISGCIRTSLSKEPKLLDYIQEFQSLGFEKICFKFLNKILKKSQKIIESVESSEISNRRKKAFIKFLNKQLNIIKNICHA